MIYGASKVWYLSCFLFAVLSDCVFLFTHKYFINIAIFVHSSKQIKFLRIFFFEHSLELTWIVWNKVIRLNSRIIGIINFQYNIILMEWLGASSYVLTSFIYDNNQTEYCFSFLKKVLVNYKAENYLIESIIAMSYWMKCRLLLCSFTFLTYIRIIFLLILFREQAKKKKN